MAGPRKRRSRSKRLPTPGCGCGECLKRAARQASGSAGPMENAGRVQHGANEKGWRDYGFDTDVKSGKAFGYLTPAEISDRHERETHGKPLPAAYRYIIGPAPKLRAGDTIAAQTHLDRIRRAMEQGGWTKSEWMRLYRMRDKWKTRADGHDHRFNLVGNKRGGLDREQSSQVNHRRVIDAMKKELDSGIKVEGD